MTRKFKIILSIVLGSIITNLLKLPLPKYLIDSKIWINDVMISFAWFLVFVGISNLVYHSLGKIKIERKYAIRK